MPNAYGLSLLTCDAISRDPNGKITLYGIFDRIWSSKFPTIHPIFAIYWRCVVPGPGRVGVELRRPDGSTLADLELIETGKEGSHAMQGTYTLGGIEFSVEGQYSLILKYNGQEILRADLTLVARSES